MFMKTHFLIRKFVLVSVLLGLFCLATETLGEQQDPNEQEDFFGMSLEELMEVPVVVSASRQEQKQSVMETN